MYVIFFHTFEEGEERVRVKGLVETGAFFDDYAYDDYDADDDYDDHDYAYDERK
jgi:hypothetical protein